MRISALTILMAVSLFNAGAEEAVEVDQNLSKETTRALLENLSGLPPPIGGPIPKEPHDLLRGPVDIYLSNGREFSGSLSRIAEGMIQLRIVQDGGQVVLSFPTTEVEQINLPGDEIVGATLEKVREGNLSDALPYLESIIGARYALFPILPPEDLSFFRALPLAALAVDNPAQAIAYVRAIEPYLTLPDDQEELQEIELLSYYQLQLREEAEELANLWVDQQPPFADSGLGYFVLSSSAFEDAKYEEALEIALRPIVYSGTLTESYLSPCYSIAIASAHLLGDPIARDKLFQEMIDRDIAWQPLLIFQSASEGLADLTLTHSQGQPITIVPSEDSRENLIETPEIQSDSTRSLDPSGTIPL